MFRDQCCVNIIDNLAVLLIFSRLLGASAIYLCEVPAYQKGSCGSLSYFWAD